MTYIAALLILISISCFVAGQILLKHAMDLIERRQSSRSSRVLVFAAAIAAFAVNFFLNIGLLQRFDLSYFFPFQGLSVILIALFGGLDFAGKGRAPPNDRLDRDQPQVILVSMT